MLRRLPRPGLLVRFGVVSVIPLLVLGVILARDVSGNLEQEAVHDARTIGILTAQLRIQPQLSATDLRRGLAAGTERRLRAILRTDLAEAGVVRVKIWNRDDRVVFSDDRTLVGRRFAPSEELESALGGTVASEVSQLERAEQARDRRYGQLVEVYVPLRLGGQSHPAGAFEVYVPYRAVAARIQSQAHRTYLLLLAGLVGLWAALFRIAAGASKRLRRQSQENAHQATHDALTGLPNRPHFHDQLNRAITRGRPRGDLVAILLMDLDRFKEINDTLGHHTGDLLLREIGPRVRAALPAEAVVARLGGDEFAVLLPRIDDAAAALDAGRRLLSALEEPFDLDGLTLHTDASVGIAIHPQHGDRCTILVQHADVAMYYAKEHHSGVALYEADHDSYNASRLLLFGELRGAIDNDELILHYQPQVDLHTGRVTGVEALVRWQHPARGLLGPNEFVPLAEQTALMRPLTLWVLEAALRQWRAWHAEGIDLRVAVNLSVANLLDTQLPEDVARLLRSVDAPPNALQLEITESVIMADPARARTVITQLSAMGLRLAIDDYGTGHSSLAYLKRLPVDELKIDKSFVLNMVADANDAVIVRSTIDLAHNLSLEVVAEGVESEQIVHALSGLGCDVAQGFHLSRPAPAADMTEWVREWSDQRRVSSDPAGPRSLARV